MINDFLNFEPDRFGTQGHSLQGVVVVVVLQENITLERLKNQCLIVSATRHLQTNAQCT